MKSQIVLAERIAINHNLVGLKIKPQLLKGVNLGKHNLSALKIK